jgi:hypothetical protein
MKEFTVMPCTRIVSALGVAGLLLSVAAVGGCTDDYASSGPVAVQATKPSVTYAYRTDQDLVQATRAAESYCRDHGQWARARTPTTNADGTRSVVFECDPVAPPVAATVPPVVVPAPGPVVASPPVVVGAPVVVPTFSYAYSSERDLEMASRNAEAYCRQYNSRARRLSTVNNTDGTRTATYRCEV